MLTGMFGLLNIHKPPGPTSHDVVDQVRRRVGRKVKVGHAGTLDPFAEGVLMVCLGPATRLADYIQAQPKRYRAEVTLGATSDTDDPTGEVTATANAQPPSAERVREVLGKFVGTIRQVPPVHSAVHVDGRRAYKLARAGKAPPLEPREVVVHNIDVLSYAYPLLELDVYCGSGTYIRALAHDVGAALGCGGYCSKLVRTAVGGFTIDDAVPTEQVDPSRDVLSAVLALGEMPRLTVNATGRVRLAMGKAVKLTPKEQLELTDPAWGGEIAAVDEAGQLLAIGVLVEDGAKLQPKKVFISR